MKKLSEEQIQVIEDFAGNGVTLEQIADYFMITRKRLCEFLQNEDIKLRYQKAKAKGINTLASTLFKQAEGGNTTALIFWLKTRAGWTESIDINSTVNIEINKFKEAVKLALAKAVHDPETLQRIADEIEKSNTTRLGE